MGKNSGHFTKVGDDDYVGPSGKHFNYNQVRAYYSNGASYDGGLSDTVDTGEGPASGASMDDAEGDRGDVAPPATGMPRAMASRCMSCGKDLSVRDANGGGYCQEHAEELASPEPHNVPRPGGGITAPKKPITAEFGGPGSGPHASAGKKPSVMAQIKTTLHGIGQEFKKEYSLKPQKTPATTKPPKPTAEPKQSRAGSPRVRSNGPEMGVDWNPLNERVVAKVRK